MKVLVFGSLNIDYVYSVQSIVRPGETISSTRLEQFPGGKGLNQAIALARAGARVYMAGTVGPDGSFLTETLQQSGVDCSLLRTLPEKSGHAIIQVEKKGQNSIVLYGGTNQLNDENYIEEVLAHFEPGDILVLQNEINLLPLLIQKAKQRGMVIALNPSPFDDEVLKCDLSLVDIFLLNEVEGEQITGNTQKEDILKLLTERFPKAEIVLTLGKAGVNCRAGEEVFGHGIYNVPVVDTTAAGDTFTGYYIAGKTMGLPTPEILRQASVASSIAVSRKGAGVSIPSRQEVLDAELELM